MHLGGRQSLDETMAAFLEEFVPKLHATGNQLMLCSVTEPVLDRLKSTKAHKLIGEENIFPAKIIVGASLEETWSAAEKWIAERKDAVEETSEKYLTGKT